MNRRTFIATAIAGVAAAQDSDVPPAVRALKPMLDGIVPITDDERAARVEKARRLMHENKLGAIYLESGTSMFYFTGKRQPGKAWILPAKGAAAWIDAEPAQAARALRDAGVATGRVGLEEQVRFATFDGLRREASAVESVSATPVTAGCRMIKSPAEIALMQRANDITIAAYKAVLPSLREGMTQRELSGWISAAYRNLGVGGGAMAIFGKYTAFPHGSIQPQQLREGDIVLIDDGCSVEGYQSDITRTTVFGRPTQRQIDVWNLERKAQDAALAAARPGAPCEAVDAAARKVITDAGFGPGYKVPGLPHRTGHGIGLDGHEWTNLVKGNKTRIAPGMCFSNEPTIAIYGEFGVRLEDCMYVTDKGAVMFTKQSTAIDQPFG
ncbi:MAG TPA: Xaa-Pro peptidase family protein [Candidatus Acidoferrales bacterium]|nr:Xaa-Pro peptidase family protein [Candidatus Acidoferrales bacterium]